MELQVAGNEAMVTTTGSTGEWRAADVVAEAVDVDASRNDRSDSHARMMSTISVGAAVLACGSYDAVGTMHSRRR